MEALFDSDRGGGGDKNLIQEIFNEEEAVLICSLPMSRYRRANKLIWRPTTIGMFTVRSAYHMEKDRQAARSGAVSSRSGYTNLRKSIWGLQVPNASKVFMWRAYSNILPTKDNLLKRGIVLDDSCIFCNREKETALHILWECPPSMDVWGVCARSIQKCGCFHVSFLEVVDDIIPKCSKEELYFFAITEKKIWARRNVVVHGGDCQHPNRIVHEAQEMLLQCSVDTGGMAIQRVTGSPTR